MSSIYRKKTLRPFETPAAVTRPLRGATRSSVVVSARVVTPKLKGMLMARSKSRMTPQKFEDTEDEEQEGEAQEIEPVVPQFSSKKEGREGKVTMDGLDSIIAEHEASDMRLMKQIMELMESSEEKDKETAQMLMRVKQEQAATVMKMVKHASVNSKSSVSDSKATSKDAVVIMGSIAFTEVYDPAKVHLPDWLERFYQHLSGKTYSKSYAHVGMAQVSRPLYSGEEQKEYDFINDQIYTCLLNCVKGTTAETVVRSVPLEPGDTDADGQPVFTGGVAAVLALQNRWGAMTPEQCKAFRRMVNKFERNGQPLSSYHQAWEFFVGPNGNQRMPEDEQFAPNIMIEKYLEGLGDEYYTASQIVKNNLRSSKMHILDVMDQILDIGSRKDDDSDGAMMMSMVPGFTDDEVQTGDGKVGSYQASFKAMLGILNGPVVMK